MNCVLTTNGCTPPPPIPPVDVMAELGRRGIAKCNNMDLINDTVVRFEAANQQSWMTGGGIISGGPYGMMNHFRVLSHSFINVASIYDYSKLASLRIYTYDAYYYIINIAWRLWLSNKQHITVIRILGSS